MPAEEATMTPEQFLQRLTQLCREAGVHIQGSDNGLHLYRNADPWAADIDAPTVEWDQERQAFKSETRSPDGNWTTIYHE
jgi:hypothetical protein